jgi:hypothetical protein
VRDLDAAQHLGVVVWSVLSVGRLHDPIK